MRYKGIMKSNIQLLGTDLKLHKGDKVLLINASNLPEPERSTCYYAALPHWGDYSILVYKTEVDII